MMMSRFDIFIERILSHEGGYVNHPDDPGGETNWGITKNVAVENGYTGPMIRLSRERAIEIYRTGYWQRVHGDDIPNPLAFQVFDAAVNHGPKRAIQWMQQAYGLTADGVWGPVTQQAIYRSTTVPVVKRALEFNRIRLKFYTDLATWKTFGKGWARRIADNLFYIAEDM